MFKAEDAKEYCRRNDADAAEMAKSITNLRNQNVDAYREIGRSHAVLTALGVPSQRSEFGEPEGPRNLSIYERIEKFAEYMETKKGNGTIPICTCKHCAEARAVQMARDSYIPPDADQGNARKVVAIQGDV